MIMGGLVAAENPSADFSHDNGWLVLVKALVIFVFLVVTTLVMIWASAVSWRACSRARARTGPGRSACCSRSPTASSSR